MTHDAHTIAVDAQPGPFRVAKERTALVVVDAQNAYLSKGGYIDLCGFDVSAGAGVIAEISRIVAAAREADIPVIWFQNGFSAAFRERDVSTSPLWHKSNALKFMREHPDHDGKLIIDGTWDFALVDSLKPEKDEVVMVKQRYSCFCATGFEQYLQARDIRNLIVIGVNTNVCVESTIRDAYHREYFALMVPAATMPSGNKSIFDATVFNVEKFFGWTATTDAVCEALGAVANKKGAAA
jgi:ureidoacrylate peracid hydrolase